MVRQGEEKVVKAMKEAKTADEMVNSWSAQRPGWEDWSRGLDLIGLFLERKPEMISYTHDQLWQLIERGILDPKTRYLVILGCYMTEGHWVGILPQCCNAKAAGATEEEIMEVAAAACYARYKIKMSEACEALNKVFENPQFKKIKKLEG